MDFLNYILSAIDPTALEHWAENILGHQFTQMTLAFSIAHWLNSNKMKKEIKLAFASLIDSINNVATTVSNELAGIKGEIKHIDDRVKVIETKMGDYK